MHCRYKVTVILRRVVGRHMTLLSLKLAAHCRRNVPFGHSLSPQSPLSSRGRKDQTIADISIQWAHSYQRTPLHSFRTQLFRDQVNIEVDSLKHVLFLSLFSRPHALLSCPLRSRSLLFPSRRLPCRDVVDCEIRETAILEDDPSPPADCPTAASVVPEAPAPGEEAPQMEPQASSAAVTVHAAPPARPWGGVGESDAVSQLSESASRGSLEDEGVPISDIYFVSIFVPGGRLPHNHAKLNSLGE